MLQMILMLLAAVLAAVIGKYPEAAAIVALYALQKWFLKTVTARSRSRIAAAVDLSAAEATAKPETRLGRFLSCFHRIFTPAVIAAAAAAALFFYHRNGDWRYALLTACTFLVISCPWMLAPSLPLAYLCGAAVSLYRGIRFRDCTVMEKISNMRLLAVAKTGILTDGAYGLQRVAPAIAFEDEEEGTQEAETEEEFVLRLCAGASAGASLVWADAVVRAAQAWKLEPDRPSVQETPAEDVVRAVLPEGEVLCGPWAYFAKRHISVPEPIQAYGWQILTALNGEYIGTLLFADRLNTGAESLIKAAHHVGAKAAVITRESTFNATAVAKSLEIELIHGDLQPSQKAEALKQLRKKAGDTLYIGNGHGDEELLEKADASGVLQGGSEAARKAAGIVYAGTALKPVEDSIDLAFCTTRIASENVFLSLLLKAGILFLGMMGFANLWFTVLADAAIAVICVVNAVRLLHFGKYRIITRGTS